MALQSAVKIRARNAAGQNRTITFSPFLETIDTDVALKEFAEKVQPVITDSITSYEVYRIRSGEDTITASPGVDGMPNSTKDSTIFKLENDIGAKTITIQQSASAYESDTAAFNAYATAVYDLGNELTTYVVGDYAVTDVTLRATYDYQVEDPS